MKHPFSGRSAVAAGLVCLLLLGCGVLAGDATGTADPPSPDRGTALRFEGTDAYVALGNPDSLHLSRFTLECWFRRDGEGTPASTGTGGLTAIPLITKGRGEQDGDERDMNFFLGIDAKGRVLAADFEEGSTGAPPGLNHPILGTTPIEPGTWHHAAATYDGGTWRLYLDGNLEAELVVGRLPQAASLQPAALATALNSLGESSGRLEGALDEVRIWSIARSGDEVRASLNSRISTPEPGLVGVWGFDAGEGTEVRDTSGNDLNGTITGTGWSRDAGAPFDIDIHPAPAGEPPDVASDARKPTPGPDFSIVLLPDTQYYTAEVRGGTSDLLRAQVEWVVANRRTRNIVFVSQLGDCVEHGDFGGNPIEWVHADSAFCLLEDPDATGLEEGIPFSISVGNHDQSPEGDAAGTTDGFNSYFGTARFQGRSYYGGHFGTNNDNHYCLFRASGIEFLLLSLEYDEDPEEGVLAWAAGVLAAHPDRRAIVVSHWLIDPGNPGNISRPAQSIYNALKDSPNLSLMVCGHMPGEGRRTDVFQGHPVPTLLSDYQDRANGGDGWLRILEFSPANDELRVFTYSPTLDRFERDADSEFRLPMDLSR